MRSLLAVCVTAFLWPQDPPAAVLRTAQQLAATTPEHARLLALVGEWDVTLTASPPATVGGDGKGTLVAASILGGRWLVLNFVLELAGQKVEAVQMLGFDTLRQQFTSSWRDDLSTWAVECRGSADPARGGMLDLRGSLHDARDPGGRPWRCELELAADTVAVRCFDAVGDNEVLVQSQRWQRRR